MKTRQGTEQDIPEVVRVINSAFRVEDFFINGDRTNAGDISARMADPDVRFFVVESDQPDGLAGVVIVEVHGHRGHFAMLSVDPQFQGRGLGRLLMNEVERHCRESACEFLDLDVVNLREELPAFYEAMGFLAVDTAPFPDTEKLTRDAHMVHMTKSL